MFNDVFVSLTSEFVPPEGYHLSLNRYSCLNPWEVISGFLSCSMFLTSQLTVTTTTTSEPVTVVCSTAVLIIMKVMLASTSVGQTSVQHDMLLLPQLIPRDTVKGSADLTTMLQQQQPQSQMPSQAYITIMPWVLHREVSLSELIFPLISYVMCWCM